METRVLRSVAEVRSIEALWRSLHGRVAPGNPFLSFEWAIAWLENVDIAPFVVAVFAANELVGLLPLAIASRRLSFVEGDAFGFLAHGDPNEIADRLVGALAEHQSAWDLAVLNELLDDSPSTAALAAAFERHDMSWSAIATSTYPFVRLEGKASYEVHAGKKVVKEIQRRQRQLEHLGKLRFVHATSRAEIEAYFPLVTALHRKRWADRTDTSAFTDERRTQAMYEAALSFSDGGSMCLDVLLVDEQLVAFSYGFVVGGRHVYYSPGFDPAYAPYSVSKILLYWQLRECERQGLREFDFSRGEEAYKLVWTPDKRPASTVVIDHVAGTSRIRGSLHETEIRATAWLKKQPRVVHFRRITLGRIRYSLSPSTMRHEFERFARSARRSVADRGVASTTKRVLERVVSPLHSSVKSVLYAHPLPVPAPSLPGDVTIDWLTPSDFTELESQGRYNAETIVRAHYNGARCLAAWVAGTIASYAWVMSGKTVFVPELGRDLDLGKDQVYLYDCYTTKAYRGRGLYPLVLTAAMARAGKGMKKALIVVELDNPSSARGVEKSGFAVARLVREHRWLRKPSIATSLRVE